MDLLAAALAPIEPADLNAVLTLNAACVPHVGAIDVEPEFACPHPPACELLTELCCDELQHGNDAVVADEGLGEGKRGLIVTRWKERGALLVFCPARLIETEKHRLHSILGMETPLKT